MPSAIFAICCLMLLYSRCGSALRIAEVDDHRSGACNSAYTCANKCCTGTATAVYAASEDKTLADCMKKGAIATPFLTYVSKDCKSYAKDKCVAPESGDKCKAGATLVQDVYEPLTKKAGAKGDPHVINMAGEKFDILATGTFSLISLTRTTEQDLMIKGTIARFGTKCGESFITSLEHTGGWIREAYNTGALKVRVVQDVPKTEALQVTFGQKWKPLSNLQEMAHVSKTADAVKLDFSSVTVKVRAQKHWRHNWNFLNLDVQGLASLDDSIRVGGLLGYDDHTHVLQGDADCARFAETDEADTQSEQSCLSNLKAT